MDTQASAPSSLQKLIFGNRGQNIRKRRYQSLAQYRLIFLPFPKYFVIDCLPNFILNREMWIFGPNLPKKVIPVKSKINEHHN